MNRDKIIAAGEQLRDLYAEMDPRRVDVAAVGAKADAITAWLTNEERSEAHILARDALEQRLVAFMAGIKAGRS